MAGAYQHLRIEKEERTNERRTKSGKLPGFKRDNPQGHGKYLGDRLQLALADARKKPGAEEGRIVLKLNYTGILDFAHIDKHGIEFLSQEDNSVCIVFATEKGLAEFAEHLAKLGKGETDDLTYLQILLALDGVGSWSKSDRESWALRRSGFPATEKLILDVELWPVNSEHHPQRLLTIQQFERWLAAQHIRVIDRINRDSLLLYRLEVTRTGAELLLEHQDVRQVDLPPQSGIHFQQLDVPLHKLPAQIPAPAPDAARICILDSGINSNHPLLKSAIAEAESYITGVGVDDEAGHGTAVAGIALYGDLEDCVANNAWHPELWLCSGKVMTKAPGSDEATFDVGTIENSIENAVRYFAGEVGCRIFNLSLGNENAPYDERHIKGIAYTLDRLAREFDILFVVSAGNFRGTETLPRTDWRAEYPEYLLAKEAIIIDPAPALNVITVGALANHDATHNEQRYGLKEVNELSPAKADQPSPFTRHGPSLKGAIKPELVAHGGNLATPMRREGEQWKKVEKRLGVLTTSHTFIGANLLRDISGTSFAAPYISHLAGRLLNSYPMASANLLRALLVNHANVPEACRAALSAIKPDPIREVAGYGKIDTASLYQSTEQQVVLIAEDTIRNDAHQFYELPLPQSFLRGKIATRQLRVTFACSPPVRTTRKDYLATKMSFQFVEAASLEEVQRHFNQTLKKETTKKKESKATLREVTATDREKGTVQSSIWTFKRLSAKKSLFLVVTRQDKDWGSALCLEEEQYALVATVNDLENHEAQLYTQIQNRIKEKQQQRTRVKA